MFVLALVVEVHLPACRSLKDRRAVVRPVLEGARNRYRVSSADVGFQDKWQRARLGFAVVASSEQQAFEVIDHVERFVWSFTELEVSSATRHWLETEQSSETEQPTETALVTETAWVTEPTKPPEGAEALARAGFNEVGRSAHREGIIMPRRRHGGSSREYPRTARVNELVREIVADELERIDDPRLEWVSVTAVEVTSELANGVVYFSSLSGPEGDPEVLEALGDHRIRLQRAIGRQARLRRTPELAFRADSGVRDGLRMEEILRDLGPVEAAAGEDASGDEDTSRDEGT